LNDFIKMFGSKRHSAVTEPSQPIAALCDKLDYVLSRFARHDHALALVLKGQLKIMTVFSELVTEITGHIATEQGYIDAVDAYQDSVKSLVSQLESGQDYAAALDALKAEDAKVAVAKTTLADSQSKITPPAAPATTVPATPAAETPVASAPVEPAAPTTSIGDATTAAAPTATPAPDATTAAPDTAPTAAELHAAPVDAPATSASTDAPVSPAPQFGGI
jgi:hypothetical protein